MSNTKGPTYGIYVEGGSDVSVVGNKIDGADRAIVGKNVQSLNVASNDITAPVEISPEIAALLLELKRQAGGDAAVAVELAKKDSRILDYVKDKGWAMGSFFVAVARFFMGSA
ncbi:hypothetical protein CN200_01500 [Sinorhizobium meliloti]|uniref:hypothetical protein n=1 Tax=Rhizobium meliloti TaxID=382 RepID=UPI000FD59D92|nr:hypothetical protein [Sinorhizobium meliloti]RVI19948.1 hypothetical protein CN200_01500 [Sinorhizobium meliloti]RVN91474.1 hypothetical protein CN107_07690 [Sinorhizobium meliloti]RVO14988.1 hypothetical protein CN103_06020 [Sinorhizobium meliloti]